MASEPLDRRGFIKMTGVAATVAGAGVVIPGGVSPAQADGHRPRRKLKMVVGTQRRASTTAAFQEFTRHGVTHWVGYPPSPPLDKGRGYWLPSEVEQTRELAERNGVTLDMVALPFLTSSHIDRDSRPAIMLAKSPERDRDIDDIHKMIEACAIAGVPAFKYNMSLLGVLRTSEVPGRGGSTYSRFRAADLSKNPPLTKAGVVDADSFWERIDYFVQRVIPVAHHFKVRAACHPQDPGTPPGGYQGITNVLSVPGGKGLFKFLGLHRSPYHGLNLCVGTLAEMLYDPPREIYDIVRRLARTKRLFNIHLRNIRGHRDDFLEVWPDEGDVDHARIIRILAEEGYAYNVDPDHVPDHPDDPGGKQAYAHGYGYLRALMQAVESALDR
ncbi:D-mannonate dehydratase [Actinoplanes sp. ATCC 53533]|uniref:mannonate dehydratase n=1 Tax=Actinoplanes sp. ATCC 53533 TaxID=1288362 RepID=UPI000F769194|nr:mannonate dehydratase [Actinoplanes sp. ATCC 53533]RSM56716.1 D-mannonate dehydratase [Actinoplanes sp. ATCC 53533]